MRAPVLLPPLLLLLGCPSPSTPPPSCSGLDAGAVRWQVDPGPFAPDAGIVAGTDGLGNFFALWTPAEPGVDETYVRVLRSGTTDWSSLALPARYGGAGPAVVADRRNGLAVFRSESVDPPDAGCEMFPRPPTCRPNVRAFVRTLDLGSGQLSAEQAGDWNFGAALGPGGTVLFQQVKRDGSLVVQLLRGGALGPQVALWGAMSTTPEVFSAGCRLIGNARGDLMAVCTERYSFATHPIRDGTDELHYELRAARLPAGATQWSAAELVSQSQQTVTYSGYAKVSYSGAETVLLDAVMNGAGTTFVFTGQDRGHLDPLTSGGVVDFDFGQMKIAAHRFSVTAGTWDPPATLATASDSVLDVAGATLDESGNALVAYKSFNYNSDADFTVKRFAASTRTWSGADWSGSGLYLSLAIDSNGNAFLATQRSSDGLFAGFRPAADGEPWSLAGRLDPDNGPVTGVSVLAPRAGAAELFFEQSGSTYRAAGAAPEACSAGGGAGGGGGSSGAGGGTAGSAPAAPLRVTAVAGNSQATVSWDPPDDPGSSPITGYIVTASPGGRTASHDATAPLQAMVTGLTNGTPYTFTVQAVNTVGTGPASLPSNAVVPFAPNPPTAPRSVTAQPRPHGALVSWTAPADDGGAPISRYTVTGLPGGSQLVSGNATSALVVGLADVTTYTFTVIATNSAGDSPSSAPSNPVTTPGLPGAPTNVRAQAGLQQVVISFDAPASDGNDAITTYVISAAAPLVWMVTSSPTTLTNLAPDRDYAFTVTAQNGVGAGPPSAAVTARPWGPASGGSRFVSSAPSAPVTDSAGLALTATALDSAGEPVPQCPVSFACSGGASVAPTSAVTDASGRAFATVVSTVAGPVRCTATFDVPMSTPISRPVDVTFTPGPPDPARSSLSATPTRAAADGAAAVALSAAVKDVYGNAIPGVPLTFTVSGTRNDLSTPSGVTDALGQLAASLRSFDAEPKTISVTVGPAVLSTTATFVTPAWVPATSGLEGGAVQGIAIGPVTGNVYVAGWRGVERSTDHGATFAPANRGMENQKVTSIAAVPRPGGERVYAMAGSLFVSDDAGATWQARGAARTLRAVGTDGAGATILLGMATGSGTLSRSIDEGQTWQTVMVPLAGFDPQWVRFAGGGSPVVFAGGGQSVAVSSDFGQTWTARTAACQGTGSVRELAVDSAAVPRAVYVACSAPTGLVKSTDDGVTWSTLGGSAGIAPQVLVADPTRPGVIFSAEGQTLIKRTVDGGATWTIVSARSYTPFLATALAVDPTQPSFVYAGSAPSSFSGKVSIGFQRSTDGGATFSVGNAGRASPLLGLLVRDPSNGALLTFADQLMRSTDNGATWTPRGTRTGLPPNAYPASFSVDAAGTVYASLLNQGIFRMRAAETAWTQLTGLPGLSAFSDVAADPSAAGVAYVVNLAQLYRTIDGGATWTALNPGPVSSLSEPLVTNDGKLFVRNGGELRRSTDRGATWSSVLTRGGVIYVDRVDPRAIYIVGPTGLLEYTGDGGGTISTLGMSPCNASAFAPQPRPPPGAATPPPAQRQYLATFCGLYRSDDAGATWALANDGLPATTVLSLLVDPVTPDRLWAGTDRRGICRTSTGGQTP